MKKHHLLWLSITSLLAMSQPVFAIEASPKSPQSQEKGSLGKDAVTTDLSTTPDGMKGPSMKAEASKDMPQPLGNADKMGKAGLDSGKTDYADKLGKAEPLSGKADYADKAGKAGQLPGKPVYSDKLNKTGQLPGKAAYTGKLDQPGYTGKLGKTGPIPSKGGHSGK